MYKPSSGVDKNPKKHFMTTFKQIQSSKKAEQELHLLPAVQPTSLKNERNVNTTRNTKVSVLAMNTNSAPIRAPLKHATTTKHSKNNLDGLVITGKAKTSKMTSNFRHGNELRDSIANIN